MGTTDRITPIWPVGCPTSKTKNPVSSRHHDRTSVTPTDRGEVLWATVKRLWPWCLSIFPIFYIFINTLSLYLPILSHRCYTFNFSLISSHFHSIFTSNLPFSFNLPLSPTNFTSFHHFFLNFISPSTIVYNHLLPCLILLPFHLNSSFFFLKSYFLGFSFTFSFILQQWHPSRDKGVSRK